MLSRVCVWFLLGCSVLAPSLACKARESLEQDSRPLPSPEPPASASPAIPRDDAPSTPKKRPAEEDGAAAKPKKPAADAAPVPVTTAAPSVTAAPTAPPVVAAGGTGAATAPALPSAPTFAAPSAACLARCQGAMQGCLSAPVDGGVPGFGNLELCKKAFEACQAACK